tara:strand:- start:215 stop:742 length:528 start_codon:yes stop_codon:yes gene_type:complete
MIKVDNIKKINYLYKNYIKQYSPEYLSGSTIYIGDCLINNNKPLYINLYIREFIKKYKNNFIKLLMDNNKIYNELNDEQLCVICLEDLKILPITDNICNTCNIKCHTECLSQWYAEKNKNNVCPICLKVNNEINNQLNNDLEEEYNMDCFHKIPNKFIVSLIFSLVGIVLYYNYT